jgi:hypothetical protein
MRNSKKLLLKIRKADFPWCRVCAALKLPLPGFDNKFIGRKPLPGLVEVYLLGTPPKAEPSFTADTVPNTSG